MLPGDHKLQDANNLKGENATMARILIIIFCFKNQKSPQE